MQKNSIRFRMSLVQFKKMRFSSDIIAIYTSLRNSWVVNLHQILQLIPDFDTVVNKL